MTAITPDIALSPGADATPVRAPRRTKARFSKKTYVGFGLIAFFVLLAIFGPTLAPDDPNALGLTRLTGPSAHHLFGTTQTGEDIFSQILIGARSTMIVGFASGAIATLLSVIVGLTAGTLGGNADEGLSLLANVFLVIPGLPLLIVLTKYLHGAGNLGVALVISITGWAWGSRVLRAQTLSLRKRDFVEAARIVGEPTWRVIFSEILPNELAIVASSFISTVLYAVLTQIALAFLGLTNTGIWSWGTILYWAGQADALSIGTWWWFVFPGIAIALLGMSLALCNFGIDEFISPRLRDAGIIKREHAKEIRQGYTPVIRRTRTTATVRPALAVATPNGSTN
jgi:peptide/nickel transport system permease protein